MTLDFFAAGIPQTKGSARAFVRHGRPIITNDNPKAKAWQGVIAHAAHEAGAKRLEGPVRVEMTFVLPRPKSHFGTGRNATELKASAPIAPCTKPDIDKMARVVLDALTGVAYADDGQVAEGTWRKTFGQPFEPAGVAVRVSAVTGLAPAKVRCEICRAECFADLAREHLGRCLDCWRGFLGVPG